MIFLLYFHYINDCKMCLKAFPVRASNKLKYNMLNDDMEDGIGEMIHLSHNMIFYNNNL